MAELTESFIVPAVRKALEENDEEDLSHKTACFDGSWQNVEHNCLNDIISATSLGTREVLACRNNEEVLFCFPHQSNF